MRQHLRIFSFTAIAILSLILSAPAAAKKPRADQPLPAFQFGVTGLYVVPQRDRPQVIVDSIEPNSAAAGKFKPGDEILAVNGTALADPDPRITLGNSITQAEATNGLLNVTLKRENQTSQVTIRLEVLGVYSPTWPVNCNKSRQIVEQTAAHTAEGFRSGQLTLPSRAGSLGILFLLSTGDDTYLPTCREAVQAFAASDKKGKISQTWNSGFLSIALGEYYLRTGDRSVLQHLQAIADDAYGRMIFGGWGHWDYPNPEYTRSGLVNAAGGKLFVGMMLARECGVRIDPDKLKDNIRYFYQFAGYGGVPYGDQRPTAGGPSNGKSGMAAVGLGLLPDADYQKAAGQLAIETADGWYAFEGGHTGNMTNMLWRNLCTPLVPEDKMDHYHAHMNELRWYFELCRHPQGGLRMLPTKNGEDRYTTDEWGLCAALAYTAGLKTLRMTGAPPTPHSMIRPVGAVLDKHDAFVTPDHAEGLTDEDFEDLQTIVSKLRWSARRAYNPQEADADLPPIDYIVKHFRHYNPLVRNQAASAIGYHGDEAIPEIIKAIRSDDPRVRRAGLQGLSGYMTFFMNHSGGFTYTAQGVGKAVPDIIKVLENPQADLWEIDGALWALSMADQRTIAEHLALLTPFLEHDSWWVQSAAFVAITSAGNLAGPAMDDLFEAFAAQPHVAARNDFIKRLHNLIIKDQVPLSASMRQRAVQLLGEDLLDTTDREPAYIAEDTGYYNISTIRILLLFEPDELVLIADLINQQLAQIGDPNVQVVRDVNYKNLAYLLIGDKGAKGRIQGQPGLLNMIEQMDEADRAKLMPGLKALLAGGLDILFTPNRKGKDLLPQVQQIKDQANALIQAYEAQHGVVTPTPVP